jgi:antitoxin MazE
MEGSGERMSQTLKVVKIGNSQGVRIPKTILNQIGIGDSLGQELEVIVKNHELLLRVSKPSKPTLNDIFRGFDLDGYREEN